MRRLLAPAALLLLSGCQALDPTTAYREAARKLSFTLSRVEPHLDLAFPLDQSRLRFKLHLKVENASDVRLAARTLGGAFTVQVGERTHALGQVGFPAGLDLAPRATSEVVAEVVLDYATLKEAWAPLRDVIQHQKPATWHLEGEARVEVYGIPVTLPLRATRKTGP